MNKAQSLAQCRMIFLSWGETIQRADSAYSELYNAVHKKLGKGVFRAPKNPLPRDSWNFLASSVSGEFRDDLMRLFQPFADVATSADIERLAHEYLAIVEDLSNISSVVADAHLERPQAATQFSRGAVLAPATMAKIRDDSGDAIVVENTSLPVDTGEVMKPTISVPQPRYPVQGQQEVDQSVAALTQQITQAQRDLAQTLERVGDVRRQIAHTVSGVVSMQDWHEIAGKLDASESQDRQFRESVMKQFVDVVTGYERQYLDHRIYNTSDSLDPGARFQNAIRTMIGLIEHILSKQFALTRIAVSQGSEPDRQSMTWNNGTSDTSAHAHELTGRVAYVVAPGYYRTSADGRITVYQPAEVVLYGRS